MTAYEMRISDWSSDVCSSDLFVEVDEATALERRIKRDLVERAYTEEMIRYQWKHHVKPAYEQYLLPYRDSADLIIQNPPNRAPDLPKSSEERRVGKEGVRTGRSRWST